jgi:hypothetical protein
VQGNIILTDENFLIQALLRTHKYDDSVIVAAHEVYPINRVISKPSDHVQPSDTNNAQLEQFLSPSESGPTKHPTVSERNWQELIATADPNISLKQFLNEATGMLSFWYSRKFQILEVNWLNIAYSRLAYYQH